MASPENVPRARQAAAEPVRVPGDPEALRAALTAVRRLALAQVASAWASVTVAELSATIPVFAVLAAAAVLHGQRSAVRFADVWFSALTRRPPSGLDPAPFLGVSGTDAPLPAVLASSSAYVRHALAVGHPEPVALSHGLHRAERLTASEVYRAGTDAVAVLATRSGSPGWRRQLGPKACEVCRGLASGEIEPWSAKLAAHPHCSCFPEPVLR